MKTLALLYPGCISFEILLACERLHKKFPVEVVTPDGADHVATNGLTVRADKSLREARASDYAVALVPGGDPVALVGNAECSRLLREIHAGGGVLGAICAGPLLLEQAGLLRGLRIAHGYQASQLAYLAEHGFFQGVALTEELVVVEGRIVTARPEAYAAFADAVVRASTRQN